MTNTSAPVTAYWVLNAPGILDGYNTGLHLRNGIATPEDKTFELAVTDDRYSTSTSFDDKVPTVIVACYMLDYGPEVEYHGAVMDVGMRFRQVPGQHHGLDIPDEFDLTARFTTSHDPDSAYIAPVRP